MIKNLLKLLLCIAAFFPIQLLADELPILDGVYLNDKHCERFKINELELVEFSVEQAGRMIGIPGVGCLVATVKDVRPNRYLVEVDCNELGELWHHSFFLDVISPTHIRKDGVDLKSCNREDGDNINFTKSTPSEVLVERWHILNEDCRGGSGDDPVTALACESRSEVARQLDERNMCFGQEDQSRSEYQWHQCNDLSARYE